LRQVGGSLEIESAPGDGTTVSASVPALYRGADAVGVVNGMTEGKSGQ
jgi:chemotaxis protein histidine kinase CheA